MTRPDGPPQQTAEFTDHQVTLDMSEGQIYRLPIRAQAGQTLSIVAAGENPYIQDTLLVLLDEFGNPVAGAGDRNVAASDWNAQLSSFTLPEDGLYQVAVTQYGAAPGLQMTVTYSLR
jgi:hypothetical protein